MQTIGESSFFSLMEQGGKKKKKEKGSKWKTKEQFCDFGKKIFSKVSLFQTRKIVFFSSLMPILFYGFFFGWLVYLVLGRYFGELVGREGSFQFSFDCFFFFVG